MIDPQNEHCTFCDLDPRRSRSLDLPRGRTGARLHGRPARERRARLVVPREHYDRWLDVPPNSACISLGSRWSSPAVVRSPATDARLNIVVNSGRAAGQDEPHYHVHIIPRREGDGFDFHCRLAGRRCPTDGARRLRRSDHRGAQGPDEGRRHRADGCGSGIRGISRTYDVGIGARERAPHSSGQTSRADGWRRREGAHGEILPSRWRAVGIPQRQ